MTKINELKGRFYWIYLAGIFLILAFPLLVFPPWFFPADWGKSIALRITLAILIFAFIFQLLSKKRTEDWNRIKNNKIAWALIALFAICLIASIFSVDPYFSFWGSPVRSGGFVDYAFYIGFALFTYLTLKKADWKKALDFSIIVGSIVSILAGVQYFGLFSNIFQSVDYRPSSTSGNPIMLSTYLLLVFFIALIQIFRENTRQRKKYWYGAALLILLFGIIITESRAAYFGLVIALIYFFMTSQKRLLKLKIAFGIFLAVAISSYLLINTVPPVNQFLSQNKILREFIGRTSFSHFVDHNRFAAWQVGLQAATSKPLLGYGFENFYVGFDKFYDPSNPYIGTDWWDRAHNAYIQIASENGLPALLIYLALFITIFWQLQKRKKQSPENYVIYQGVQAALLAYLIAIFFSFDDFSTYLTSFFLIGYSLHLTYPDLESETPLPQSSIQTPIKGRGIITTVLLLVLVIFIWQYNFVPFQINAQINTALELSSAGQYTDATNLLDQTIKSHSFLDSYERLKYLEIILDGAKANPNENDPTTAQRCVSLLEQVVKIQPHYTRAWLYMGAFENVVASGEQNPTTKANLLTKAEGYLTKALTLAPKRQEIFIEETKGDIVAGNYNDMVQKSNQCIAVNSALGDCYWMRGLAEVYLDQIPQANTDFKTAEEKGFASNTSVALSQLLDAYFPLKDYTTLATIYEKLVALNPNDPRYYPSLALVYRQLGQYQKARQVVAIYVKLNPAGKAASDAFLATLPQ